MNPIIEKCMLSSEQKSLILKGINQGIKVHQECTQLLPETITKKYTPFFLSDLVNTYVANEIENHPHTQMKVMKRKAGFHPYIVIHDTIRNIFILISKLHENQYILTPSGYRGDFASSNGERLQEMGMTLEEIYGESPYQYTLSMGIENQPFCIIVCYDGKSGKIYEGALRPDQEDWIYKIDITESIINTSDNLAPLNNYQTTDIQIKLKPYVEDEIVVKLKDNKTS